ncbi:hypothetical protein KNE206_06100 [Kitasatospora sp. NE20-6]
MITPANSTRPVTQGLFSRLGGMVPVDDGPEGEAAEVMVFSRSETYGCSRRSGRGAGAASGTGPSGCRPRERARPDRRPLSRPGPAT